jgi:glycine/D-amino acid oxidase-like deaminating enzyme
MKQKPEMIYRLTVMDRIDPQMAGVEWAKVSKEPAFAKDSGNTAPDYDLAIIGAGYCGLSIARNAALQGLSVIVLEAGTIGYVVPHFPGGLTPDDTAGLLGKKKAERLAELVAGGAAYVFDQIRELQIQCDAEQTGWIQPAHSETSLRKIERVFAAWRKRDIDIEWLDAGEIRARVHRHILAAGMARRAAW